MSRTSSAMKVNRLMTFSGRAGRTSSRSFSSCVQTPTGQVLEWHCRTMMQPIATRLRRADAELLGAQHRGDDDVAPGLDARRRCAASRGGAAVERQHLVGLATGPSPTAVPAYLIEVCGEAPVPPTWPEIRIDVGLGLGDARRDRCRCRHATTSFTQTRASRIDLLQVVDELRQILDRIDVVVRRRARSASRPASSGAAWRSAR